jgi:hypothetical protein
VFFKKKEVFAINTKSTMIFNVKIIIKEIQNCGNCKVKSPKTNTIKFSKNTTIPTNLAKKLV